MHLLDAAPEQCMRIAWRFIPCMHGLGMDPSCDGRHTLAMVASF
jgi:hypothetical protein